jgi:hypothetical protein
VRVVGEAGAPAPLGLDRPRGPERIPLALRHHRQEALDAHHACAADAGDRRLVHALERGPERGRVDDARVQHARQHQVLQVAMVAGHLLRHVGPGERLADEAEAVVRLERGLRVDLQIEGATADQLAESHRAGSIPGAHHPVRQLQLGGGPSKARRGHAQQGLPRGGGGATDLDAAPGHAVAAAGAALVRRERGVALDHRDAIRRQIELLAHHLADGDARAGAEVHPAHEDRDGAVAPHREVGVDRVGGQRLAEEAVRVGDRLGVRGRDRAEPVAAQADDEGSARREAGGEEGAAREPGRHLSALPACGPMPAAPRE